MVAVLKPSDIRAVSPAAQRTIRLADLLGWTIRWASNKHQAVRVQSPMDDKYVIIPTATSVNAHRSKSMLAQVISHTPREALDSLLDGIKGDLSKDDDLAELALMLGLSKHKVEQEYKQAQTEEAIQAIEQAIDEAIQDLRAETKVEGLEAGDWYAVSTPEGDWFECRMHEPPTRTTTMAGVGGHNSAYHPAQDKTPILQRAAAGRQAMAAKRAATRAARTEVSRTPWVARKGRFHTTGDKGRVFEHSEVSQVTFADGHIEFECAICQWRAERGRQVSAHVGQAHKDRPRQQPDVHVIDNYEPTDIHPVRTHNRRLRAELLTALDSIQDWESLSREDLATRMEQIITENRPDREPAQPLTDVEVLARIKALVDRGEFDHLHSQVESLTARVVALGAERDEAQLAAADAQEKAERAEGNIQALREMLTEAAG